MPRRLIEEAFPLQKVSKDSADEQEVNHGRPNGLHYWPARRPLAACRAVTIAALLPDPADASETIKAEYTRLSGSPLPDKQRKYLCDELIASLTRWGDENGHGDWESKDQKGRWVNKLRIARELIWMAQNGRPPKVMDMFAGGGAIPLEAMRLGCAVTANDYNPVAWFLLKCTLEYPQRFARKTHELPDLNLNELPDLRNGDLANHIRLWEQWVLEKARGDLVQYYPLIDDKPTVAYLWARTIPCQDPRCDGTIPLLKTLWVCKKAEKTLPDTPENRKRPDFIRLKTQKKQTKVIINGNRALKLCPDTKTKQVCFEIFVPKEANDVGPSTMSGATATCPFCGSQQPGDYIKQCGHEGKLKAQMTTVVYQEKHGKEYRPPTKAEIAAAEVSTEALDAINDEIPHGIPDEPMPGPETLGFRVPLYGFKKWSDLFTPRQLLSMMTFVKWTRAARVEMEKFGYSSEWIEAASAYLALLISKVADYNCTSATWGLNQEAVGRLFVAARIPITWDYGEANMIGESSGSYQLHQTVQGRVLSRLFGWPHIEDPSPSVTCGDVLQTEFPSDVDLIVTDPPYYDAVPYADASDFFFVWNKRNGFIPETLGVQTADSVVPKAAELIQHTARFGGAKEEARTYYTQGRSYAVKV